MKLFKKIQEYILPREVDFFQGLQEQSILIKNIIDELHNIYITKKSSDGNVKELIQNAQDIRREKLNELYQVFITPVDKEAIGRAYINLDWVVMSIEHLEVELKIYKIADLTEYETIINLLKEEMNHIHHGFEMLQKNDFDHFSKRVFSIVHCDNKLIEEYARRVADHLDSNDLKMILTHKEILAQLKEISKRIRICANDLEDMLFKMG